VSWDDFVGVLGVFFSTKSEKLGSGEVLITPEKYRRTVQAVLAAFVERNSPGVVKLVRSYDDGPVA